MARVLLVAPPFSGHLHPTIAAARALAHDHEVVVVSTASARARIESAGVLACTLLEGRDAAIEAIADPGSCVGSNPILLDRSLRATLGVMEEFQREFAAFARSWKPDMILAESVIPVAGSVARALGIPWWTLMTSAPSVYENRSGPTSYVGGWRPLRGPLGRLRDALGWAAISGFKRAMFLRYGALLGRLGFAAPYRADGSEVAYSEECVLMTAPRELEFVQSWRARVHFIGPLLYAPQIGASPKLPAKDPRRKRIFVSLGTHVPWVKAKTFAAIELAIRDLPDVDVRCSFGDRNVALDRDASDAGGRFVRLPYADYAAELRDSDLVIHHAGTGIAHETLLHGVPALCLPIDYDQFDTAVRLEAAGVARRLGPLPDIGKAIASALSDDAMRLRARSFADTLGQYDAERTLRTLVAERLRNVT